jgi:hypothetical protein
MHFSHVQSHFVDLNWSCTFKSVPFLFILSRASCILILPAISVHHTSRSISMHILVLPQFQQDICFDFWIVAAMAWRACGSMHVYPWSFIRIKIETSVASFLLLLLFIHVCDTDFNISCNDWRLNNLISTFHQS